MSTTLAEIRALLDKTNGVVPPRATEPTEVVFRGTALDTRRLLETGPAGVMSLLKGIEFPDSQEWLEFYAGHMDALRRASGDNDAPETYPRLGYARAIDLVYAVFSDIDKEVVLAMIGDDPAIAREIAAAKKQRKEELLATFLEGEADRIGRAMSIKSAIIVLQKEYETIRSDIQERAREEIDPTVTWWGEDEMVFVPDDRRPSRPGKRDDYPREEVYPTAFRTSFAGLGEISGTIDRDTEGNRILVSILKQEDSDKEMTHKVIVPNTWRGNPATYCFTKTVKHYIEQTGFKGTLPNRNVPGTVYGWEKKN